MKITLAAITAAERRLRAEAAVALAEEYLSRSRQYAPCEFAVFRDEAALLAGVERLAGRSPAALVLLDSTGKSFRSSEFAAALGGMRDGGRQHILFGVGPADGWTAHARARADLLLSLSPMTLPHALAQAVLAEQVYRALTILAGHPYHCGH